MVRNKFDVISQSFSTILKTSTSIGRKANIRDRMQMAIGGNIMEHEIEDEGIVNCNKLLLEYMKKV